MVFIIHYVKYFLLEKEACREDGQNYIKESGKKNCFPDLSMRENAIFSTSG